MCLIFLLIKICRHKIEINLKMCNNFEDLKIIHGVLVNRWCPTISCNFSLLRQWLLTWVLTNSSLLSKNTVNRSVSSEEKKKQILSCQLMAERDSCDRKGDKPAITAFTHSPKCTQILKLYSKTSRERSKWIYCKKIDCVIQFFIITTC